MTIDEKLLKTRFVVDISRPHITVNTSICSLCQEKACMYICPAQCFQKEGEQIILSWQNCMECGSCRTVCPAAAITWDYPKGGFGVCYRFG